MCDSGPLCEFLLSRTLLKTKSSRTERDVSSDGMLKVVPCPRWSLPHRRHKGEPVNGWLSSDTEDAQTGHGRMHRQYMPDGLWYCTKTIGSPEP